MGLDTSHDCWHGAYSRFARFREDLALCVNMKLDHMAGFGGTAPWPSDEKEPLCILLNHSDCDGEIPAKDCLPLANRMEEMLPMMVAKGWEDKMRSFIFGLREAAASGEDVEFR